MAASSWSIARFGPTSVRMHWSFLLLLGWFALVAGLQAGLAAALNATLFIVLLFVSVVAHEFGHVAAARRFGVRTREILLLPIGGMAKLDRIPDEPRAEFTIALAGPAVTAAVIVGLAVVLGGIAAPAAIDAMTGVRSLLAQLLWANVVLLVFNLLPIFPMDGGRVLRAVLGARLDNERATVIASVIGQVAALAMGLLAIWWGQVILLLVAIFIFFAAAGERNVMQLRRFSTGRPIEDMMVSRFAWLRTDDPLAKAESVFSSTDQSVIPVVDALQRPAGFIVLPRLVAALRRHGERAPVSAMLEAPVTTVVLGTPAEEVTRMISETGEFVAVVDAAGQLVGYQSLANLREELTIESIAARRRAASPPGASG